MPVWSEVKPVKGVPKQVWGEYGMAWPEGKRNWFPAEFAVEIDVRELVLAMLNEGIWMIGRDKVYLTEDDRSRLALSDVLYIFLSYRAFAVVYQVKAHSETVTHYRLERFPFTVTVKEKRERRNENYPVYKR